MGGRGEGVGVGTAAHFRFDLGCLPRRVGLFSQALWRILRTENVMLSKEYNHDSI